MSEFLQFNQRGQWSLHKATNFNDSAQKPPKSDYTPGSKQYKVYGGKTMTGELHEDHGTKGTLRDFGGGARPKNSFKFKNVGKPARNAASVHNERNPGVGD